LLVLDADDGGSQMTPLLDAAPALQPAGEERTLPKNSHASQRKVSHLLHGKHLIKPIYA
jgi:hypothetical protein